MNRSTFLEFVQHPESVSADAAKELEEVVRRFPWFHAARILLAKSLQNGNDFRYPEALKDAALHAGDRKRLFELFNDTRQSSRDVVVDSAAIETYTGVSGDVGNAEPEISVYEKVADIEDIDAAKTLIDEEFDVVSDLIPELQQQSSETLVTLPEETDPGVYLPEIVRTEIEVAVHKESADSYPERTFADWLRSINKRESDPPLLHDISVSEELRPADDGEKLSEKELLIRRFIDSDPRIGKPEKKEFFSPVNMAKKSIEDREDIVSETLAGIFAAQGDTKRAVRIYQKLSLLNPEKNAYFAALIEKLENSTQL